MSHLDISYFAVDLDTEESKESFIELFEKELKIKSISIRFSSENATDTILVLRSFLSIQKKGGYKNVTYDYDDIDFVKCVSNYTCIIHLDDEEYPCMMNIIDCLNSIVKSTQSGQVFVTYLCDPSSCFNQVPFGVIIITKNGIYNVSGTACVQFMTNNFIE